MALSRFQKGTKPSQKWDDKPNRPQKWAQRGINKITYRVSLQRRSASQFGVSQAAPGRVQDLVESLC